MAGIPIIRSPMKPAKKGEAPTVEWAKWVEKTLRRLIDEPPPRQRPITGGGDKPPFWTDLSAIPETDPVEYQAAVTTGYLCYQNATLSESDDGVVGYLVPRIRNADGELKSIESDGTPAWVTPKLALPGLVNYIYLRVKTDADGAPKAPTAPAFPGDPGAADGPTIEAFEEPQQSVHHVRPSPSGGEEEGDYFFLICETESNGATPTPAPRVVRRITGNREMPNQLIEITNIGGKRELYQGYLVGPDDKHEFRTLEQLKGDGEPVIKELDPGDPDATPPVPAEEEGDTIKFRRVAERATSPQIQIKDGGDVIRVEGNEFDAREAAVRKFSIGITDGLVTAFLREEDDGWWGTVQFVSFSGSQDWVFYIEAGGIKRIKATGVDVPGTEQAPGLISIPV